MSLRPKKNKKSSSIEQIQFGMKTAKQTTVLLVVGRNLL